MATNAENLRAIRSIMKVTECVGIGCGICPRSESVIKMGYDLEILGYPGILIRFFLSIAARKGRISRCSRMTVDAHERQKKCRCITDTYANASPGSGIAKKIITECVLRYNRTRGCGTKIRQALFCETV